MLEKILCSKKRKEKDFLTSLGELFLNAKVTSKGSQNDCIILCSAADKLAMLISLQEVLFLDHSSSPTGHNGTRLVQLLFLKTPFLLSSASSWLFPLSGSDMVPLKAWSLELWKFSY